MMTIFFTDKDAVRTYEDAKSCNLEMFKRYFLCMNKNGINIPQSQFEALFLSSSIKKNILINSYKHLKNLQKILAKNNSNLKVLQKGVKNC